jgi:hypothetical protein
VAKEKEFEEVEVVVIAKRELISNSKLLEEVREWVDDLVYSLSKDTKYYRIDETYLLVKTLMA